MQAWTCLGKFVGQRRGDAVGRLEQAQGIELIEVTNHKGHRHGFTDGTTQAQHDAANHTRLGIG